jgi:hypothetical protein
VELVDGVGEERGGWFGGVEVPGGGGHEGGSQGPLEHVSARGDLVDVGVKWFGCGRWRKRLWVRLVIFGGARGEAGMGMLGHGGVLLTHYATPGVDVSSSESASR